jgi:hypothetical protein
MYREIVDWFTSKISTHTSSMMFLAHIPAGDDKCLAQGELPWAAFALIPWLPEQFADPPLQLVELLSVQS